MRICFATSLYPPDPGGPATYIQALEEGLPSFGIELITVKFGDVRHLPKLVRHFAFFWNILRAGKGADAIFVQDTTSTGVPAAFAALIHGLPLIVRVPGDLAWEQARQRFGVTVTLDEFQTNRKSWRARVLHAIQRWTVARARTVIVPSEYFRRIVSGWGIPDGQIVTIYHGIELPDLISPQLKKGSGRLMVSVGRFVPWKGFGMLISLLPELPGWTLGLVGDGPERSRLEKLAQDNGVVDRVIFTGGLPRQEALGWCAQADVLILNTSFESFSFQIAEAMMLGTPIITTKIGSLPELIDDGREGLLLQPDDRDGFKKAVESIDTDPGIWKERTEAARLKAEEFSMERMLSRTADTLKRVI